MLDVTHDALKARLKKCKGTGEIVTEIMTAILDQVAAHPAELADVIAGWRDDQEAIVKAAGGTVPKPVEVVKEPVKTKAKGRRW